MNGILIFPGIASACAEARALKRCAAPIQTAAITLLFRRVYKASRELVEGCWVLSSAPLLPGMPSRAIGSRAELV